MERTAEASSISVSISLLDDMSSVDLLLQALLFTVLEVPQGSTDRAPYVSKEL